MTTPSFGIPHGMDIGHHRKHNCRLAFVDNFFVLQLAIFHRPEVSVTAAHSRHTHEELSEPFSLIKVTFHSKLCRPSSVPNTSYASALSPPSSLDPASSLFESYTQKVVFKNNSRKKLAAHYKSGEWTRLFLSGQNSTPAPEPFATKVLGVEISKKCLSTFSMTVIPR